jgi:hypothetical protein
MHITPKQTATKTATGNACGFEGFATPEQIVNILRQIEGGRRKRQDDAGERAWKPKSRNRPINPRCPHSFNDHREKICAGGRAGWGGAAQRASNVQCGLLKCICQGRIRNEKSSSIVLPIFSIWCAFPHQTVSSPLVQNVSGRPPTGNGECSARPSSTLRQGHSYRLGEIPQITCWLWRCE